VYLIVGGSGFIGTNFAKFLIENDYEFRIYDKQRSKFLPKGVNTVTGDVRDKFKLSQAMKGCDAVFHLVTIPPSSRLPDNEIYDIEVNGTKNVLDCAEKNGVKKVIFASSASHVYGLVEPGLYPLREDSRLNPVNEYGRNKVIAEGLCKKASENNGINTIVLRLSMVLGAYNFDPILIENMLPLFKNKRVVVAGDGKSKNQSIHVEDVNTALLYCGEISEGSLPKYDVFNISGRESLTMDEWIDLSKRVIGSDSNVVHLPFFLAKNMVRAAWCLRRTNIHPSYLDLMSCDQYFGIDKAKKVLGWESRRTIDEALRDTVDFLRKEFF